MIGPSGKPNRPPRENRKAASSQGESSDAFGRERLALRTLFAAKIAAAYLYASKHDVAAIVASLRAEERAMVAALRRRKRARSILMKKWSEAARGIRKSVRLPSRRRFRLRKNEFARDPA
jgi:hypothetical protein